MLYVCLCSGVISKFKQSMVCLVEEGNELSGHYLHMTFLRKVFLKLQRRNCYKYKKMSFLGNLLSCFMKIGDKKQVKLRRNNMPGKSQSN